MLKPAVELRLIREDRALFAFLGGSGEVYAGAAFAFLETGAVPHEYLKLLEYAAFGSLGGLIGAMTKSRTLRLPRLHVERLEDGEIVKVLDTGILAAPLLGSALAMYFDTRPENALAWGLAAGYAGPTVLNVVIDPLLRKFGFNPNADVLKPSPSINLNDPKDQPL